MNIPLPKVVADVGPGGPFVTSAKGLNSLKKLQAEAKYAPYTEYANALSKISYGQTAPANALAQILASPAAANMDKDLYNKLAQQANTTLQGYNTNFVPNPQSRGNSFGNSLAGNVFSSLINRFLPQSQSGTNFMNGPTQGSQNSNNLPNDQSTGNSQTPGYNTQFSRQSAGSEVPGSMGANNPTSINEANSAAMTTTATGQAANQNELQKTRSAAISTQSQTATQALKSLEAFNRNYLKSSYRGQYLGENAEKIPSPPGGNISPEQLSIRYANQYLTDLTGLGETPAGKTDEGRSLIAGGKPDLSLDKDAQKELYESNKAKLHRIINSRDFVNNFYRKNPGATDDELIGMMNAYNRYAPSYDYENGKSLPENDKKFRDFTSTTALQSYRNNGDYNPYIKKENKKTAKGDDEVIAVFNLTNFKNDKEFNDWYRKQAKSSQIQIRKQLEHGVYGGE